MLPRSHIAVCGNPSHSGFAIKTSPITFVIIARGSSLKYPATTPDLARNRLESLTPQGLFLLSGEGMQSRQSSGHDMSPEDGSSPVGKLSGKHPPTNPEVFVSHLHESACDGPKQTQHNSPDILSHAINNQLQLILDHSNQIFYAVTDAPIRTHCLEIETAVGRIANAIRALAQSRHSREGSSKTRKV